MFKDKPLLVLVLLIVVLYLFKNKEPFSTSGLTISDRYCTKLADVYHRPEVNCPHCRDCYRKKICGKCRRHTINFNTGNYFTEGGELV
jgi:hypothetical protein